MSDNNKNIITEKAVDFNISTEIEHGIRVSNLAYWISRELNLSEEESYQMAIAGMLHDIGKLKLSHYLYEEKEKLNIDTLRYIRKHPTLGYEILANKYSKLVAESILHHHENYDGTGYPDNLSGEEIPLGSRILRISDVFAALTSDRPYRRAFDKGTALELMIEEVKNFDVKIFIVFQRVIHDEQLIAEMKVI
jgi:HD-GYP domain